MKRFYWPLLALASIPDGRLSPVQLQKALFLLGEQVPQVTESTFYHFIPHHYGPFDATVYRDMDELIALGFVDKSRDRQGRDFLITEQGRHAVEVLKANVSIAPSLDSLHYLENATEWVKSLSFEELIKSIYRAYPNYKSNSIFKSSQ